MESLNRLRQGSGSKLRDLKRHHPINGRWILWLIHIGNFCRYQHRIIGNYLALHAWVNGLDCIVLVRSDLEAFLGLQRFKSTRVKWLQEDLKPWFRYQCPYYKTHAMSSIHSLFLARIPIEKHLPKGSMTTEERIRRLDADAPRTERFSTRHDGSQVPSHAKIISKLSVFAAGLDTPRRRRRSKA